MGCISSKLLPPADLEAFSHPTKPTAAASDMPNHIVSLTSSTYGVLDLCPFKEDKVTASIEGCKRSPPPTSIIIPGFRKRVFTDPSPEIINWDLDDDLIQSWKTFCSPAKKPSRLFTPSPKIRGIKFSGKENNSPRPPCSDPNRILKPFCSSEKKQLVKSSSSMGLKKSRSRRSLSPLFDLELVASFERELYKEAEQIRQSIPLSKPLDPKASNLINILLLFEEKCPPGGENAVVLYTTTLRGIRKTFEECNAVRSAIESCNVCFIERDISMDLRFRDELRMLMGSKEARPPVMFVKGRKIGSASEVLRLVEEGKLELLMQGIRRAARKCGVCGGVRFLMCMDCNGSCRILNREKKEMMKCGKCNENGLVFCPLCCHGV